MVGGGRYFPETLLVFNICQSAFAASALKRRGEKKKIFEGKKHLIPRLLISETKTFFYIARKHIFGK